MALRRSVGASVTVPEGVEPFVWLLSESTARAVVTAAPEHVAQVEALAAEHGVPIARIGEVTGSDDLRVTMSHDDVLTWTLAELRSTSDATLPALFG